MTEWVRQRKSYHHTKDNGALSRQKSRGFAISHGRCKAIVVKRIQTTKKEKNLDDKDACSSQVSTMTVLRALGNIRRFYNPISSKL